MEARDAMLGTVKAQQASEIFLDTLGALLVDGEVAASGWRPSVIWRADDPRARLLVGKFVRRPSRRTSKGSPPPGRAAAPDVFEISIPRAMEAVQQSLRRQGRAELKVGEQTLLGQLAEDGKLLGTDLTPLKADAGEVKTRPVRVDGRQVRCARIPAEALIGEGPGRPVPGGGRTGPSADATPRPDGGCGEG